MCVDDIAVNDDFFHIGARWNFIHHVEKHIFDDAAQSSRACALFQRTFSSGVEGVGGEDQFNAVKLQELLLLFNDRVLWLCQDANERRFIQAIE